MDNTKDTHYNGPKYQYYVGTGNETYDTRHEAIGKLAIRLRNDPFTNPYYAGSLVEPVTATDTVHDDVPQYGICPNGHGDEHGIIAAEVSADAFQYPNCPICGSRLEYADGCINDHPWCLTSACN